MGSIILNLVRGSWGDWRGSEEAEEEKGGFGDERTYHITNIFRPPSRSILLIEIPGGFRLLGLGHDEAQKEGFAS